MIYFVLLERERAAELTVDPSFGYRCFAWRMYECAADPRMLACWISSHATAGELRAQFALPRVYASSVVALVEALLDQPGIYGGCIFSAGRLVRARPVRRRLDAEMDAAAPIPLPPVPAGEVVDLSVVPDTPDISVETCLSTV